MCLQQVLCGLGHHIAELACVGRNDLDHPVDHFACIKMPVRRLQKGIELPAKRGALGDVLAIVEPAENGASAMLSLYPV